MAGLRNELEAYIYGSPKLTLSHIRSGLHSYNALDLVSNLRRYLETYCEP